MAIKYDHAARDIAEIIWGRDGIESGGFDRFHDRMATAQDIWDYAKRTMAKKTPAKPEPEDGG